MSSHIHLQLTSAMAPNSDSLVKSLCEYLTLQSSGILDVPVRFSFAHCDGDWTRRAAELDSSDDETNIVFGWICGFPYILARDGHTNGIYSCRAEHKGQTCCSTASGCSLPKNEFYSAATPFRSTRQALQWKPLAAPVFGNATSRYLGEPVYFSDVIVRATDDAYSTIKTFKSLLDCSSTLNPVLGYNEHHSHSGYNVTRAAIFDSTAATSSSSSSTANMKFKQIGSHLECLKAVIDKRIDVAVIDSIVLETEMRNNPDRLKEEIRVIDCFGPSPAPPFVVNERALECSLMKQLPSLSEDETQTLSKKIQNFVVEALCNVPSSMIEKYSLHGFKKVDDTTYNSVREMLKKSLKVDAW